MVEFGPADVRALAITHQRETFVCLDADGEALRPAILWLDTRATTQAEQLGRLKPTASRAVRQA